MKKINTPPHNPVSYYAEKPKTAELKALTCLKPNGYLLMRGRLSLKSTIHAGFTAGLWKAKAHGMLWTAGCYRFQGSQLSWLSWFIFLFWQRMIAILPPALLRRRKGREK